MQEAKMPTPMRTDPSRAARARVTWHAISWGVEEVNLLWMVKVLLLSCQRKAPLSPYCHLRVMGLQWPHLLHLLGACEVETKKKNKVKVPQEARVDPASWQEQPPCIRGWLLGRPCGVGGEVGPTGLCWPGR